MKLFRMLTPDEEKEYKQSARDNYEPLTEIKGIFHPVYQLECVKINIETNLIMDAEEAEQNRTEAKEAIKDIISMPHADFMENMKRLFPGVKGGAKHGE